MENARERQEIGLDHVLELLPVQSPYGRKVSDALRWFIPGEEAELRAEHASMEALQHILREDASGVKALQGILRRLKDLQGTFEHLEAGGLLDEVALYEVKQYLMHSAKARLWLADRAPRTQRFLLPDLAPAMALLDPEGTGFGSFQVYDAYSKKLRRLRRAKRRIEERIRKEAGERRKSLLEVRTRVVAAEEEENRKVRRALSEALKEKVAFMRETAVLLGQLDFVLAKAVLAETHGGIRPVILDTLRLEMEGAVHLRSQSLLEARGQTFQPLDIQLDKGVTVVTGANMGGKSVSLRNVLLQTALVHLGYFPFADRMECGLLDAVFHVGQDMEKEDRGLSTFGAEVMRLREIMEAVKGIRAMVVLDEPAKGTNPKEGRAIVRGLCEHFNQGSTIGLVSTHFDHVVAPDMVHYQIRGLKGVQQSKLQAVLARGREGDLQAIEEAMDHRMQRVDPGAKVPGEAVAICALLGFEKALIERIQKIEEEG